MKGKQNPQTISNKWVFISGGCIVHMINRETVSWDERVLEGIVIVLLRANKKLWEMKIQMQRTESGSNLVHPLRSRGTVRSEVGRILWALKSWRL